MADLFGAPAELGHLHVFRNRVVDWVVAWSVSDAARVYRQYLLAQYSGASDWSESDFDFTQEPDKKILAITDESRPTRRGTHRRVRRSCRRWAAENGRGFLASTEF